MKINNPYLVEYRQAIVRHDKFPTPENKAKLDDLQEKSRVYVQERLNELGHKESTLKQAMHDVKQDFPSPRQQLKASIKLYRNTMDLISDIRELKEELRTEISGDYCKQCKKRTFNCPHQGGK